VKANLSYLESLLNDPEAGVLLPAAVIVEAVQGEGGVIPADIEWLRGLRRITEKAGVALIVDEIQSGFARTGKMFAFEHAGIIPDVVVLSKAIGGSLPLAVVGLSRLARHLAARRARRDVPWQPDGNGCRFGGDALSGRAQGLRTHGRHG
jgi:4-aminobutyrate aminotransferase-like enzyme